MRQTTSKFSRKALNILIFVTAILILVFSQMGTKQGGTQQQVAEQSKQSKAETNPGKQLKGQDEPQSEALAKSLKSYFPELQGIPDIPQSNLALDIEKWQTSAGLTVLFLASDALPMVDVRLVFDAGSARDPQGEAGLASMTANLVQLGAQGLDATAVAQEFETLGAQTGIASYQDMAVASLRVLSDDIYFEPSVDLFGRVVSEIEFAEDDLKRELNRQMVGIAHKAQNPNAQTKDAVFDMLYGKNHPYGHPSEGTLKSLAKINAASIIEFHSQFYVAKNAVLAVVGDIDRARVEALATRISDQLGTGEKPQPIALGANSIAKTHKHIDFPSDQTHIVLLGPGVERQNKDYFALYLTNHILGGGGFASLLNKKIRQEKAFAYSVSSGMSPMAGTGSVLVQMQTRSDQAAAAITATNLVIDALGSKGPSENEMADAKQQILSEFALRAASNSSQLGYLGSMGFYNLPLDYLSDFNGRIEAVTAEDVKQMTNRYFKDLAIITLGSENPLSDDEVERKSDSQSTQKPEQQSE